jgi:drug/metabolite transporter (DMT)-like permease
MSTARHAVFATILAVTFLNEIFQIYHSLALSLVFICIRLSEHFKRFCPLHAACWRRQ